PSFCFSFNDTSTTEIYTLSLHDALPISCSHTTLPVVFDTKSSDPTNKLRVGVVIYIHPIYIRRYFNILRYNRPYSKGPLTDNSSDRKSTRLNSSHVAISYAVFCLKKKKQ